MIPDHPDDPPAGTAESPAETVLPLPSSPPSASPPLLPDLPEHTIQFEQEFRNVQRVGVFYAAMLLPILVATGWSYHTQGGAVAIDLWSSGAFSVVVAVFATMWRGDWLDLMRLPSAGSKRWFIVVGLTPLVTIGAAELLERLAVSIGLPVRDIMAGFGGDGYPAWVQVVRVIVLAPVLEEVAFRGVLMAQLRRVMSPTQAIWVAAALFGALHFSVLSIAVFLVPLGAVAGYLTRETKSLLPAIVIHAAHNAGTLLLN